MDTQEHDMRIGELFRHKLENAEVIPDPSVGVNLMKRVARQEFLRFDPLRFNVYYLGAVLVAGITAGIVFSTGGTETAKLETPPAEIILKDTISPDEMVAAEKPAIEVDQKEESAQNMAPRKEPAAVIPADDSNTTVPKSLTPNDSAKPVVIQSEAEKPSQSEKTVEYSKYQDGFRTVVPKMTYTKKSSDKSKDNSAVRSDTSSVRKDDGSSLNDKEKKGNEKNEPVAKASSTEGCPPFKVSFESESETAKSSKWTVNNQTISEDKSSEYIFSEPGKYRVALGQEMEDGTTDSARILVTVFPKPEARFDTSKEQIFVGEAVTFKNISVNSVAWKWDFGDGTGSDIFAPVHKYSKPGSYNIVLVVTSDDGCKDTITRIRTVVKK